MFGILAFRSRIFHLRINLHPKNVDTLVAAACILHNYLHVPAKNVQLLEEAEELVRHIAAVRPIGGTRALREACAVREGVLCHFLHLPRKPVSWLDRVV